MAAVSFELSQSAAAAVSTLAGLVVFATSISKGLRKGPAIALAAGVAVVLFGALTLGPLLDLQHLTLASLAQAAGITSALIIWVAPSTWLGPRSAGVLFTIEGVAMLALHMFVWQAFAVLALGVFLSGFHIWQKHQAKANNA